MSVLVFAKVHALQLVLNADADLVGFVDARLIGDGHTGLEHHGVVGAQALRTLVYAGDKAHAVTGAAAVVDLVLPQRTAGKAVQRKAGAVVQKYRACHINVALQRPGVVAALVVGQRTDGVGAGDVGGAAVVLTAVVHQQKALALNDAVDLALGVVVHHGGVGAVGGNGGEAVLKIAGHFGAALLQHGVDVDLGQGLALRQCFFQVHLKAHHGDAVADVAFADVFQLGFVFDALQRKDRVGARHGLVGAQGGVQVVVGGFFVCDKHLVGGQRLHGGQKLGVIAQGHAAFRQRGGVGVRQTPRRKKQRAGVLCDQRVGDCQRGAGQVVGAQVQQPAHAVQPGDRQGGGALLGKLGAHQGDAVGGGRAGLGGRQQTAGCGGQRGAGGVCLPHGGIDIQAFQRSTALFQGGGVVVRHGGRHAVAVQQQGFARGKVGGQIFGNGRHARSACVHTLDLGACQLLVALHIEAPVAPQSAAALGDHEGGVFAGKARNPRQRVIMFGQVFAAMGVAGHDQHAVAAVCLGSGTQRGNFFVCRHSGYFLL